MAYTQFDATVPDATTTSVEVMGDDTRANFEALRDAVLTGGLYSWNYSVTAGTGSAEQPQYVFMKSGTKWLRSTLTWGTTGGADGNVTVQLVEYSSNSGSSYDAIGTLTYTYDSSANVTATTWS